MRETPLTNRYKGLVTASYKSGLRLWQFDVTLRLNGGGRMPMPYLKEDGSLSWDERFPAFQQLKPKCPVTSAIGRYMPVAREEPKAFAPSDKKK